MARGLCVVVSPESGGVDPALTAMLWAGRVHGCHIQAEGRDFAS